MFWDGCVMMAGLVVVGGFWERGRESFLLLFLEQGRVGCRGLVVR